MDVPSMAAAIFVRFMRSRGIFRKIHAPPSDGAFLVFGMREDTTSACHLTAYDMLTYHYYHDRRLTMKMIRVLIQIPQPLKAKLDAERRRGTSAAGLIRHLLEQHFKGKKAA